MSAGLVAALVPAMVTANPLEEGCAAFKRLEPGKSSATVWVPFSDTRLLQHHFRQAETIGYNGTILVENGGKVVLRDAYGFADKDQGRRMRPDAVFDIGSMTKQFTAAAILRLEEQGKVRTTDSIVRFFPDAPADKRDITLHQLLTHSAGFPHDAVQRDELLSRDQGVGRILASELRYRPGQGYQYSNAGYTLLAAIVELASGQNYERFLRNELWLPAGLKNTGNLIPKWRRTQFALGYNAAGAQSMPPTVWWVADGPSWSVRGAGYVLSTADDLVRWAEALQLGKVLSEDSRRKLFYPHVRENTKRPSYYGYGWAISAAPDGSCAVEHDGGAGYHAGVLRMYPEHHLTTVTFTSESRSPLFRYMTAARALPTSQVSSGVPAGIALSSTSLRALAGVIKSDAGDFNLVRVGRTLTVRSRERGVLQTLTAFPNLAAVDQRTVDAIVPRLPSLFGRLRSGRYEAWARVLADDSTLKEEQEFWPAQWRAWTRDMGDFRGLDVIGHRRAGDDLTTYVQLRFARSALPIEIWHRPNGRFYVNTVTEKFPERTTLIPQLDGLFLAYNAAFASGVRVRIDSAKRAFEVISECFDLEGCTAPALGGLPSNKASPD